MTYPPEEVIKVHRLEELPDLIRGAQRAHDLALAAKFVTEYKILNHYLEKYDCFEIKEVAKQQINEHGIVFRV